MLNAFDIKQAIVRLYKDKKYTLVILLAISLGLAISLFLYAQVHTRTLADLPFVDGDKIVYASRYERELQRLDGGLLNYDTHYVQQRQTSLDSFTTIENRTFTVATESSTQQVWGVATSSALFEIASEPPLLGRTLLPSDDAPNAAPVIVVSYEVWNRLFQQDPSVIGREIKVDGVPTTVVGVMNNGFRFPVNHEAWVSYVPPQSADTAADGWLAIMGKLKSGVSVAQADQAFKRLGSEIAKDNPKTYLGKTIQVQKFTKARVAPVKLIIQVMTVVAISVLLMSCFSVTSLVIVRMLSNSKEAAIKNALGIPARNIMLLPLLESFILYAVAGAIGLLLCALAIKYATGLVISEWDPFWWRLAFNKPIIQAGLIFIFIAWMITGLMPVLMATNKRFYRQLNSGKKGGAGNQSSKFMNSVVALQVAFTFLLMLSTGVAFSSFYNVLNTDYGFDSKNFLVSFIRLPESNYAELAERNSYYEKLTQEFSQVQGVKQVTYAASRPGGGSYLSMINSTEVDLSQGGSYMQAIEIPIAENYFDTLNTPLLEGRAFNHSDNEHSELVVIVSAELAKKLSPSGSALGKKMHLNPDKDGPLLTIIGIAPDLLYGLPLSFYRIKMETIYRPAKQILPVWSGTFLIAKTEASPYLLVDQLLTIARRIDAGVALEEPTSMEAALSNNANRFEMLLYNFIPATLIAFIMSALSIYAISARVMLQRTNDIGIMKALGLADKRITRLFMRDTYIKLGAGLLLGSAFFVLFLPGIMSQLIIINMWSIVAMALAVTVALTALVFFASRIPLLRVHELSPQEAINKI